MAKCNQCGQRCFANDLEDGRCPACARKRHEDSAARRVREREVAL